MKLAKQCSKLTIRAAILTSIVLTLFGCSGGKSETALDKSSTTVATKGSTTTATKLCVFANDETATKCKAGQIALFVPESWGNEQYPIIYAAKYCDFNFPIIHTNGAVSCVFFKGRTIESSDKTVAPQEPASAVGG